MNKISIIALFSLILIFSVTFVSAQDIAGEGVNSDYTLSAGEVEKIEQSDANEKLESGNTVYISPDGNGSGSSEADPTNWENALNKVSSGDTINFANGTYYDIKNTVVNNINLKGNGNTVIDAKGDNGFFATYGTVTLNRLSFINAYTGEKIGSPDGEKTTYSGEGAVVNYGQLTVTNCYFANNQGIGTEGGAIHNKGTCTIQTCEFFKNGGKKGGAIYSDKNSYLYIYDSLIHRCVSKEGSAVHAKNAYVEIHRTSVQNASAKNGLFYIKKSTMKFYDSNFYNCNAVDAAAVINIDKESSVEIDGCIFDHLTAAGSKLWFHEENGTGNGGAIVVEKEGNNVVIKNSVFTNCSAKGEGGAIYVQSSVQMTIDNCTFKSNTAGEGGNNIYSYGSPSMFTITNCEFEVVSSIETSDVKSGESEFINFTADDGSNGILNPVYSVYLNKQEYSQIDCKRGLTLPDGNYTVQLCAKDSNGNRFTFTQNSSLFVVGGVLEAEVSYTFNDDGSMNVTVTDQYGRPVSDKAVNVTIDGKTYSGTTDSNGVAQIDVIVKAGNHTVSVSVEGVKTSSSNPSTVKVNVSSAGRSVVAENITRAQNSEYDFKAQFFDANSNPLKNRTVVFILNGNEYDAVTDEMGFAVFKNSLMPGTYTIKSFNPATREEVINTLTVVSRFLENRNINIDYSYSGTYKVRVFDDDGNPAGAGESVVFKIDGKNAKTVRTDKNGYAKLVIKDNKLLPKTHTVTAEYKGVKVSNKVAVKQILKAKNKKYKRYRLKTFTATLKTSKGKPIKNKKITFKLKGKKYTAKTNKKGVAKITIKKFWKVGKHKITISYLKTSIKKTITVKR